MTLSLTQIVVYVVVAAISGYLAGAMVRPRYPFGFVGAFVASLVGEWLMVNVVHVLLAPEVSYAGIPIVTAIVGALVVAFVWAFVAGGTHRRHWI